MLELPTCCCDLLLQFSKVPNLTRLTLENGFMSSLELWIELVNYVKNLRIFNTIFVVLRDFHDFEKIQFRSS